MIKFQIFIEFLGMPGSGKTTLSHQAAEILREKGFSIQEPTYFINNEMRTIHRYLIKSWYSTKLAWLRPGWALDWFSLVVQSRQKTARDFLSMLLNCFFILELYRKNGRHNEICFLDQGICQAILSLSYNSQKDNFLEKKFANTWYFLSTLGFQTIYIETDVDMIIRRLKNRYEKQSRLELIKNATNFPKIIHLENQKIEYLVEKLHKQSKINSHRIKFSCFGNSYSIAQEIVNIVNYSLAHPQ